MTLKLGQDTNQTVGCTAEELPHNALGVIVQLARIWIRDLKCSCNGFPESWTSTWLDRCVKRALKQRFTGGLR